MIYDKFAAGYDRSIAPLERRFLSRWREETLSLMAADSTILEIGAGTGLNFRFYPECRDAVASDISLEMLRFAQGKTDSVSLIQADAMNLPFGENTFDAAFATLVFCSIPDPDKAFAEIIRILRPNGRLVLLEHVRPEGLPGYLFDFINLFTVPLMEDHFNRRTADRAEIAGLKIVEIRTKAFGIVNLIVCEVVK